MADQKITPDLEVTRYQAEWLKGKEFVDNAIKDFKRLDTIANAQYDGANDKNPNIGDTTVAGIVRQIMRTAVKQIPHVSMAINGSRSTVEAITCQHLVDDVILNPNTFAKGLVNILHLGGRGALSRGFNVFEISTTKMFGQFGVTPRLIHFNDFAVEAGIQDGSLSPFTDIRIKMTPTKLQSIYERESKKRKGTSTWNLPALQALIAIGPDSNGAADYADYITPMEQDKISLNTDSYDLIVRKPLDKSQPIVTFSPSINQRLRTVVNRSKFGYPRTLFLVIDPAELSPFGDSRVRLASPNQNFLMALRQNVATTWLYNSKPTMVKMGLFTGAATLKSGGVITSTDSNASIKLLTLDTSTAQQYPTISQEITKQIQNMMGMNPGQSLGAIGDAKTGTGAQAQKQGIDDAIQQVTNIMEEFLRQYVIAGLDLYLSEQDGEGVIYVSDQTREDILRLNPDAFPDPKNPNALRVNWNELYEYIQKIDATVDTTMSKEDWSNEKRGDLQDAVVAISQSTDPNDPEAVAKKKLVEDKLLDETAPELSTAINNLPPAAPVQPQPGLTPPMQ
ncbi:MAG TPA: hypothetical protein VD907_06965 [Verrucomicrobiae bacterium]|nr:hypothetical protein [Verrucomicrobiae bacterium]